MHEQGSAQSLAELAKLQSPVNRHDAGLTETPDMTSCPKSLHRCLLALAALGFCVGAQAETGLRVSPRAPESFPGKLRLSTLDSTYPFSTPRWSTLSTGPSELNLSTPSVRADWYPFGGGLRTSAGMLLSDQPQTATSGTPSWRSEAFLGLGWTASASSSSTGSGWRLNADVGASLASRQDCARYSLNCATAGATGLRPGGGEGIRWNPFISIGASLYY
jgi:hypothetical protein